MSDRLFEALTPEQADDVLTVVSQIVSLKGGASDWTLQKTYYLAAVESIEDRLAPLPAPLFFSWRYGPWSKDLRQLINMAAEQGAFDIAIVSSKHSGSTKLYRPPRAKKPESMRNPEDQSFLEDFLSGVSKVSGDELTKLAKETVPFQRAELYRPIDLDAYLNERRAARERLSNDEKLAGILAPRSR